MNASLSVRLYHKQKKSPGCVSNKRPVIWHCRTSGYGKKKKMLREINASDKKIEDKITNRRKLWSQKDSKH
jgi:hypothetical protein